MRAASAATMTASAAVPNKFYAWLSGIFAFLVEDVERRQADVRNLLFTESDSCAFAFLVEDVERRQAVSDISSSPRVTRLSSPVFEVDVSASPLGTADAPLASDNDNPAAPNTGRALLRCFRFEVCFAWGIVKSLPPDARQVGRF